MSRIPASAAACDQRLAHGVRVVVRPPAGRVVQVVELAHAGDAGQRHLGVRRPRQREVAVGVEPRGDGVHPLAARSRTCRRRRGCGRAARGGTRGSARWRSRAARGRAAARRRGPGRAGLDGGDPAAVLDDPHARRTRAVAEPGVLAPVGGHASASIAAGQGGDAGEAVAALGELGRRVRDAGRVADEQHRGGDRRPRRGCRRRGRRRWAAPGAASSVASRSRSATSNAVDRRPRLLDGDGAGGAVRRRPPRTARRPRPARGRRARRSPRDGMALTAFGLDAHLADGGERRRRLGRRPRRRGSRRPGPSIGSSRSASRVVPAWSARPRRSSRQRPCGQIAEADPDRGAVVDQRAALLDVQFDERADPAQRLVVPSERAGVVRRPRHRLGHRDAVGVGQRAGAGRRRARRSAAASRRRPRRSGRPPRRRSTRRRPAGPAPAPRAELVERGERRHDAERPVERAAVGHRVEVAADDQARAGGVRIAPSRPTGCRPGRSTTSSPRARRLARRTTRAGRRPRGSRRSGGSRRCRGAGRPARGRPTSGRSPPSPRSGIVLALRHRRPGRRAPRRPARRGRSRRRRAGSRPCPGRWSAPAPASARPAGCRRRR